MRRRESIMGLLLHLQNIFNMKADAVLNAAEEPGQVFDYSYTKQLARRGGGAEGSAARRAVPLAEGDGQGAVPGSPGTGECERGRYWHLQRSDRNEPRHAARPG